MQTDQAPATYRRPLFPLFGHGNVGPMSPDFHPRTARQWAGRMRCLAVGCRYETPSFDAFTLYACARCSCEMLGRGWADIEPRPFDQDNDDWLWRGEQ